MKLLKLYESILSFAGMKADENGFVSLNMCGATDPVEINGLRLVIPTNEQLRRFNPQETIIFHPLAEDILKGGESDVVAALKKYINIRLNFTAGGIFHELIRLAASPTLHKGMTPDHLEYIAQIPDADQTLIEKFGVLLTKRSSTMPERSVTNIYLKKGGRVGNEKFGKVGIVYFELFEDLKKAEGKTFENLRIKDVTTLIKLYRAVFPGIDDLEHYNYGSNNRIAPFLDSLMMTAAQLAAPLNDIIDLFKEQFSQEVLDTFDSGWVDDFRNLEALRLEINCVPMQPSNAGTSSLAERRLQTMGSPVISGSTRTTNATAPTQVEATVQPEAQTLQQVMPAPQPVVQPVAVMQPAPAPVSQAGSSVDFKALRQACPSLQPQVPMMQVVDPRTRHVMLVPAPQGMPVMQQPQMVQQPMVPQQPGMITAPMYPNMIQQGYPQGMPVMQQPQMVQVFDPRTNQMVLVPAPQQPQQQGGWVDPWNRR